ncbi:MAG: helix-turn-helix transcriptional regulator [Gemmatimonadales bacterium]|nr:helix-turn-helix transcriptional regulator [Gemmatimonadales bacterium]
MLLASPLNPAPTVPHLAVQRQDADGVTPPAEDLALPDCFEFVFVEAGAGYQRIGDRSFRAEAGDLFLVAPWELRQPGGRQHSLIAWVVAFGAESLKTGPAALNAAAPDELFLHAFLQLPASTQQPPLRIDPSERPRWIARLSSLAEEVSNGEYGSSAAAQALLKLLLIDIARVARVQMGVSSPHARPILLSVFTYIERRFRAPIGLADVAKAVARSPSYLTDLVRRETGRTVLQWIIHRRMAEARRLLLDPSVRVKDVGHCIGYDDTGHFIRQFRRLNGTTPQRWRELG